MNKTIFVVDDEPSITKVLTTHLEVNNYDVAVASSGKEAIHYLSVCSPNLIILDIKLPDMDGYEILQHIRRQSKYTPVMMLTAKSLPMDKVAYLQLGADVYLTKPFDGSEIVAQVAALFRLFDKPKNRNETCGSIEILYDAKAVYVVGKLVHLTPTEYILFELLMQNKGRVLGRETLLTKIWGNSGGVETRAVDIHIQRIRRKLSSVDPVAADSIVTVRQFGYLIHCTEP